MEIPKMVKIKHKIVNVFASGRGYVRVGDSYSDISDCEKSRYYKIKDSDEQIRYWQEIMYKCFERALKKARGK